MGYYPITVSGGSSVDYTFTYVPGTLTVVTGLITITGAGSTTIAFGTGNGQLGKVLTVNKAPLTLTAVNHFAIQGTSLPALTISYKGFVNGDTTKEFTTQPTASTTATSSSAMGYYPITVSGGSSNDYTFTYAQGTLTMVTEAYLKEPISTTYGAAPFYAFGTATSGITYSSNDTLVAKVSSSGQLTITGAGTATISFGSASGQLTKTVTVNKAPLTITANNQSKIAGSANPPLTVSYSGFVNGDTQAEFTTQPTVSTTATTSSAGGSYPITVSGGASTDYTFTYVPGTLTVIKEITGEPVISYANPQTFTDGTPIAPLSPKNTGGTVPLYFYGKTTVFAGSAATGSANGVAAAATFTAPSGVAADAAGNLYVGDGAYGPNLLRKITPAGVVTTLAGSGTAGSNNGTGTSASFSGINGLAVDASGNVYVADQVNNLIRKVTQAGVVTTFAGHAITTNPIDADGTGTGATIVSPNAIAIDKVGNLYVVDEGNGGTEGGGYSGYGELRKITPSGVVSTVAKAFFSPWGVAVNSSGSLIYVSDFSNRIFTVTQSGIVTVLAGITTPGQGNGTGTGATFNNPNGLSTDVLGKCLCCRYQ
jgi:hypothetical protein